MTMRTCQGTVPQRQIYREAGGFCPLDRAVGKTKSQKHVSLGINLYQRLDGPATGKAQCDGGLAWQRRVHFSHNYPLPLVGVDSLLLGAVSYGPST